MSSKYDERPRPYADGWKFKDPSEMTYAQRQIIKRQMLNPSPKEYDYPKPQGKVPVFLEWDQHFRIFPFVVLPIATRWLYMWLTGWTAHPVAVYVLTVVFNATFVRHYFQRLREYTQTYGFLDGNVARDAIPESMTGKLYKEMMTGLLGRPLMVMMLAYDRHAMPRLDWWLPLQIGFFTLIADFVYYWVHRATHEVAELWHFHRRHHTTKHPTSYLLAFADESQEIFDAFGTPILAYMFYPIHFDALYIWAMYFLTIEIMGHSGIRMYYPAVLTSSILRPFGCEIVIEDHDLHHRHGWRESYNYGKQSLLWDALFGTNGDRFETRVDNIDWDHRVK
ncbi:hypothetical protein CBS9595_004042 [Malassezia furfur]|nr:hypothetical protein CBS9595_004042 [Malassezia furfur]